MDIHRIGTKCFYKGKPCIIYRFYKMSDYRERPMPMYAIQNLVSGSSRVAYQDELTVVNEFNNASFCEYLLKEEE